MRMPIKAMSILLVSMLVSGCPAKDQPNSAALYELPVEFQEVYFMKLSAEEQVDTVLRSFDRKQAWDMRLLDWLSTSEGKVAQVVEQRIASETDDWHLASLALAVEHLSFKHVCRIDGVTAHKLLLEISRKVEQPTAERVVGGVMARHSEDRCPANS